MTKKSKLPKYPRKIKAGTIPKITQQSSISKIVPFAGKTNESYEGRVRMVNKEIDSAWLLPENSNARKAYRKMKEKMHGIITPYKLSKKK